MASSRPWQTHQLEEATIHKETRNTHTSCDLRLSCVCQGLGGDFDLRSAESSKALTETHQLDKLKTQTRLTHRLWTAFESCLSRSWGSFWILIQGFLKALTETNQLALKTKMSNHTHQVKRFVEGHWVREHVREHEVEEGVEFVQVVLHGCACKQTNDWLVSHKITRLIKDH